MKGLLVFLVLAGTAAAQVGSAILTGTVLDPSSGAVPGAEITIVNSATGFRRNTMTNARGAYWFDSLQPGPYTIEARKAGFAAYTAKGVTLQVDQAGRLDIRMSLGAAGGESITVSGLLSPVQTEEASIGYRMDQSRISDLPLDERNVMSLVTLGPGAIPRQLGGFVHDVNNDVQQGSRGSVALNPPINGSRVHMNSFLLDGAYDADPNTFGLADLPARWNRCRSSVCNLRWRRRTFRKPAAA